MCRDSDGNEEKTTIFLIDKDLGNVAYSSWIKSVLDQGTMYDLGAKIHTMMRMRMTTTKEMKKTRKKKRKKTIEHGGDEGNQEITERSRMTDRGSRGKRPKEYLFRPGQRSINLIPGRCNC